MKYLLILLFYLATNQPSVAAPACEQPYVINLSFAYDRWKLTGVPKDMETFTTTSKGKETLNLKNIRLSQYGGKEKFLQMLKEKIKDKSLIQFQYAGHGIPTQRYDELKPLEEEYQRQNPEITDAEIDTFLKSHSEIITSQSCAEKFAKYEKDKILFKKKKLSMFPVRPRCQRASDIAKKMIQDARPPTVQNPKLKTARERFALAPEECFSCHASCRASCVEKCNKDQTCEDKCEYDFSEPCKQKCLKDHCISDEEMGALFKGKEVNGIIDACYSSNSHQWLNGQIITSARYASVSDTKIELGKKISDGITGRLGQQISKNPCAIDTNKDNVIDYQEAQKFIGDQGTLFSDHTESRCFMSLKSYNCDSNPTYLQKLHPKTPNGAVE